MNGEEPARTIGLSIHGGTVTVETTDEEVARRLADDFAFFGPTCDDMDYMEGPFALPADVQPGDWIEIGMLGAYGAAMRTKFNGFGQGAVVETTDEPMFSQYLGDRRDPRVSDNVVSLR